MENVSLALELLILRPGKHDLVFRKKGAISIDMDKNNLKLNKFTKN